MTTSDLQPYWNATCEQINSHLWLPTAQDAQGCALASGRESSSKTVAQSWFTQYLLQNDTPSSSHDLFSSALALMQSAAVNKGVVLKTHRMRLYPTTTQREIFRRWIGTSRYVYNRTVAYLKTVEGRRQAWTDIAKLILAELPEWADEIPFQVKKIAVKDACRAYSNGKLKAKKTGEGFELSFRSRKFPRQSCFIPKSAVKASGIYYTISGRGLTYAEPLPDIEHDCRLVYYHGRWYLSIPYKKTVCSGENQARIVALDPGVRTFQTFYSPDMAGFLGHHDFIRILRLCQKLDDLTSRYTTEKHRKRRYRMKKAANRLRWKIRDLRDELHAKCVRFLVDTFDIILIPTFETSQMVEKAKRKIRSKTVRSMLTWSHYHFKERLKQVAFEYGKTVIEVNEAYTSKTCSWSGEVINVGSRDIICGSDGISMHRDMNGARGILLRALAESPSAKRFRR
ncbi:MAG: transposase, partial [Chloroflexota bacterium]